MPMMRDTPPPLPADVLRDLRANLATSFGHKLIQHEGHMVLAIRVPADSPDRERDLVRAADAIPEEEVAVARDVLLIGAEKMIRLDAVPLRDAVRERLRDDGPASKEARRALEREYGATLFHPATRPRDVCLAVRVPRASVHDTTPEDLAALQAALQPVLAQPHAARTTMCYLVADGDYRRCPPEEFARVLRGEVPLRPPKVTTYVTAGDARAGARTPVAGSHSGSPFGMLVTQAAHMDSKMELAKQRRQAAPEAPAPAAPTPPRPLQPEGLAGLLRGSAPVAPAAVVPGTPPAPPAASAIIDAEAPLPPAAPPSTAVATFADPIVHLGTQLAALGYEVLTDVQDLGIHLAAHKTDGKRLVVLRAPEATAQAVQAFAKQCADLEADAGVLVAEQVAPGAWLEAAGTKVELLTAGQLPGWTA